jgi:transcriptional regulator with XRE-family HTH domain
MKHRSTPDGAEDNSPLLSLGIAVCRLRKAREYSQEGFALATGLSRSHMSKIENGLIAVRVDTLLTLCETLLLPITDLAHEWTKSYLKLRPRHARKHPAFMRAAPVVSRPPASG